MGRPETQTNGRRILGFRVPRVLGFRALETQAFQGFGFGSHVEEGLGFGFRVLGLGFRV